MAHPQRFISQTMNFKTHRHDKVCWVVLILMRPYIFDRLRYSFRQHGIRVDELSKL